MTELSTEDRQSALAEALSGHMKDLLKSEVGDDRVVHSTVITELVCDWLERAEESELPTLITTLTGTALTMLGHKVKTVVETGGKRTIMEGGGDDDMPMVTVADEEMGHSIADDEAIRAAVDLVLAKAKSLDLHGVVILSPVCKGCGALHDFAMLSDMGFGKDRKKGAHLASLLRHFAEVAEEDNSEELPRTSGAGTSH